MTAWAITVKAHNVEQGFAGFCKLDGLNGNIDRVGDCNAMRRSTKNRFGSDCHISEKRHMLT